MNSPIQNLKASGHSIISSRLVSNKEKQAEKPKKSTGEWGINMSQKFLIQGRDGSLWRVEVEEGEKELNIFFDNMSPKENDHLSDNPETLHVLRLDAKGLEIYRDDLCLPVPKKCPPQTRDFSYPWHRDCFWVG